MKDYNGDFKVEFTKVGDKHALIFDDIPSLVFVSLDGNGRTDSLFYNGDKVRNVKSVRVYSDVDEVTTYDTECYAIAIEDK